MRVSQHSLCIRVFIVESWMEAQLGCGDSGFVPVVKHACIVDRAMNTTTTTTIPTTTSEGCMHACSTRDNTHARILMCLFVTYI